MTDEARLVRPIVVSDAGFLPTTRQMAIALSDKLSTYFAAYWTGGFGNRLSYVPHIGKEFARRSLPPELSSRAHRLQTGTEVLRIGLGRLGLHAFDRQLMWRRNINFDRCVAGMLDPSTTLVAQYGASLESFAQTRRQNGRTILDYPIARFDFAYELLAEEAELRPEFADTIFGRHALTPTAEHLSRMTTEVELADLVVVGSRFAAESFSGIVDPDRLAVVPYGVDSSKFRPSVNPRSSGPLQVLFAGQLTQRKGIAYALEAIELLDPGAFQLTLVGPMIGSGRGLGRHKARFRRLSAVPPQSMPDVYSSADVLILPSIVEGSAVVVLEAMAAGLPVIVTPNVGADAVRDGNEGFVVPIRAPEAIAERLKLLASDRELCLRMGKAARTRAEACGWPRFHKRIRELVLATTEMNRDAIHER